MKPLRAAERLRYGTRLVAVVTMLSLWLAVLALQVSPRLHGLLHKDAGTPGHECLVTQLLHHSLLGGFAPVVLPAVPLARSSPAPPPVSQSPVSFDYRLSPSRAPPAA